MSLPGIYEATKALSLFVYFLPRELQTQTALGEPYVNRFSDRSSILLDSIKNRGAIRHSCFLWTQSERIELREVAAEEKNSPGDCFSGGLM